MHSTSPESTVQPELRDKTNSRSIKIGPNAGIFAVFIILFVLLWVTTPTFRQVEALQNLAEQVSMNAIIAVGMTFVIITAGIDLSVGSIQGLVGVVTALTLMDPTVVAKFGSGAMVLAVLAGFFTGAAVGLLNGVAISKLRMQPFIVTLATMWAIRGFADVITNGSPIGTLSPGQPMAAARNALLQNKFTAIGMGYIGPIPLSALVALIVVFVAHIILSRTVFGRQVYAIGGNREAARLSGINVNKTLLLVYILSGTLAGVAAIILMSRLVSGQPTAGQGYELYAIAAVVVGGTSLFGGVGNVVGSAIGALIMGLIGMGLDLHSISSFWQEIVTGSIILIAVYADEVLRRRRG